MMYDLIPANNRKSFYGKAKVLIKEDVKYLISYNSLILSLDKNNRIHRHFGEPISNTTCTHIKSFIKSELGIDYNKKKFLKLPYEKKEMQICM